MRRTTQQLLVPCAGLALGAVLWSAPAAAEPTAPSLAVEVEIAAQGREGRDVLLLTLTLTGDRGCSSAQVRRDATRHEVLVCREGGDAHAPVLSFSVERSASSPQGSSLAKFRLTSRLALGKRAVVGRFVRPDGIGTQVSALAR